MSKVKKDGCKTKEEQGGEVERVRKWFRALIAHLFDPVHTIGDKSRVRQKGEVDEDEKRLGELNREWDKMLREDEWMVRLMSHIRFLQLYTLTFFIIFVSLGMYFHFPAKHWVYIVPLCFIGATLPYWAWVGSWYGKIIKKVFEAFKKKFGKHFHLK